MTKMTRTPDFDALCQQEIGLLPFRDIFVESLFANFMAVGVPVISGLGIVGNVLVVWVNQNRKLTGLSVLLLNAMALADVMLMISLVLMYVPRGHLAKRFSPEDCAKGTGDFWRSLEYAQRMYTVVHPFMDTATCLVIWSAFLYVLEMYGVFFHPERISAMTKSKSMGLKILVIMFNLIMIMSLIHFFKFVRKDTFYRRHKHKKICLSDVYMDDAYQRYDVYVYFGFLTIFPWIALVPILIRISAEVCERRRDHRILAESPQFQIAMLLKEGRSRRTVLTVAAFFLLCHGAVDAIDIYAMQEQVDHDVPCFLVPMDRKYALMQNGNVLELTRVTFLLIYSASKFPICYITGKVFQDIFNRSVSRCTAEIKRLAKRCRSAYHRQFRPERPSLPTHIQPIDEISRTGIGSQTSLADCERLKKAIDYYSQTRILHSNHLTSRIHQPQRGESRGGPSSKNVPRRSSESLAKTEAGYSGDRQNRPDRTDQTEQIRQNRPTSVGRHSIPSETIDPIPRTTHPVILRPYVFARPPMMFETAI